MAENFSLRTSLECESKTAFEAVFLDQSEEAIPSIGIPMVSACSLAHLYSDWEKCGLGQLEKQTFNS